jgi:hypothetical protein
MNIVLVQSNALKKMEMLLLIQIGDGHTKPEIINPIVILEMNGTPHYVILLKIVPKTVQLMESVKKKIQTHIQFKLQEMNFLLDLLPKDHIPEM